MRARQVIGGCTGLLIWSSTAEAIPVSYIERPLVLPSGTMRFDGGPRWPDYDAQWKSVLNPGTTLHFLNPGLSYGVSPELEVGGVIPVMLSPSTQLENPRGYLLYQFAGGDTPFGIFAQLEPLFRGDGLAVITAGVPAFIPLDTNVRVELGGFMDFYLGDNGSSLNLLLPFYFPFQVTRAVYVGPEVAFNFWGLLDANSSYSLPVGAFAGFNLSENLGDVYLRARTTDIKNGVDVVEFLVGAELYFDP